MFFDLVLASMLSALAVTVRDVGVVDATADEVVEKSAAEVDVWEFSSSVFYSDPPNSDDRLTAILYGDRGPLHLELRYGYEDDETVSLFGGWTFALAEPGGELTGSDGSELTLDLTPMLGAVVGETDGIAPGLEWDLGWRRISWYAEMEYLFDTHDSDDNFFYSWSTLTYAVTDWMNAGLVSERSKLVNTDYSLQRGFALEFARGSLGLSIYAYNPGSDDFYAVFSVGFAP